MAELVNKDYLYKKFERDYQKSLLQEAEKDKVILNAKKEKYNPKRGKNVSVFIINLLFNQKYSKRILNIG